MIGSITIIGIIACVLLALETAFYGYQAYLERETYRILAPYYKKRIAEIFKDEEGDEKMTGITGRISGESIAQTMNALDMAEDTKHYQVEMACLDKAFKELGYKGAERRLLMELMANTPRILSEKNLYKFWFPTDHGASVSVCTLGDYYARTRDEWIALAKQIHKGPEVKR